MPLGSSSAAPVMSPGPSRFAKPLIWPLSLAFMSHLPVQAHGVERHRPAVLVVAGIGDALDIGGQREAGAEVRAVVQLGDLLADVAQRAVAEEGGHAAAREI